jgi:hypothetical protein
MDSLANRCIDDLRFADGGDLRVTDFGQVVKAPGSGLLSKARDGKHDD